MKIAFIGSREFKDRDFAIEVIDKIISKTHKPLLVISGGAKGVDTWAEEIADMWKDNGVTKKIYKAEWDKYGKSAGYRRNILIVGESDRVIAFWDGKSKGTKHSIDIAMDLKKPIDIYIRQ